MSATNRGSKRIKADFYPTPIETIQKFLNVYSLRGGHILEPSAGCGNFSSAIRKMYPNIILDQVEIREEERVKLQQYGNVYITDFLQFQPEYKYTTIIGNPPFSLALEFIEKCFTLINVNNYEIIMLLRTAFLESKRRYNFWQRYPLSKLYVLSERPKFYNNKTDATSYSFFIWSNNKQQEIHVI